MPAEKKSASVPSVSWTEREAGPKPPSVLSAGVREHLDRNRLRRENAVHVRDVTSAITLARNALWKCSLRSSPSQFQAWKSGETWNRWSARIEPKKYASRWVTEMTACALALHALEAVVGTSVEPVVRHRVAAHVSQEMQSNAGAVQDCFVRMYCTRNNRGERAAVSRDLTAILADDIGSLQQFHEWFEHAGNMLQRLGKRIQAKWDGRTPEGLRVVVDAFCAELGDGRGGTSTSSRTPEPSPLNKRARRVLELLIQRRADAPITGPDLVADYIKRWPEDESLTPETLRGSVIPAIRRKYSVERRGKLGYWIPAESRARSLNLSPEFSA